VTYVASNAYVVRANAGAAQALTRFKSDNSFVQFVGDYEPAFRMSPTVRAEHASSSNATVDITVQVIEGRGAQATLDRLKEIAVAFVASNPVLNYHNVELSVPSFRLAELAHLDNVFAIEERGIKRRLDGHCSICQDGLDCDLWIGGVESRYVGEHGLRTGRAHIQQLVGIHRPARQSDSQV
jgi:hypothetical protein